MISFKRCHLTCQLGCFLVLPAVPAWGGSPSATPVAPADGATQIDLPARLEVSVSDPENDPLTVTFFGRQGVPSVPGPDFSLVTLPDTQYYASSQNGGTPGHFNSQTQWIVDNRDSLNIAFVSHMGDCVQNGDQAESEWIVADGAMDTIEDHAATLRSYGIPWGIAPGNHDQSPVGDPNGTTTFFNHYFGTDRFSGRPYYAGRYGPNNDNNYQLFSASGLDFMIIHLEYDTSASQAVLDWADMILKSFPDRRAIVTSHYIMDVGSQGAFGPQGQAIYDNLKDNDNLFLMLCGHKAGEGQRTDVFDGRSVYTVLQNYQSRSNGGDGWLRYFVFSPAANEIRAHTYSTTLQQFETDADSQFILSYDMQAPVAGFEELGSVSLPSGETSAIFDWIGLGPLRDYEWYASVTDGNSSPTATEVRRFTSMQDNPPMVNLVSPPDATSTASRRIRLTATADDSDGAVARVGFFHGNVQIAEVSEPPYDLIWESVAPGNYVLSAVAVDDANNASLSGLVSLNVIDSSTPLTLVPRNSAWRYLDDGSDQGTAWRNPGFDDSTWMEGGAELGYGDGDETTVISFGPDPDNKYISTYFRREFTLNDPSGVVGLRVLLRRDDGAVVYLNGTEVARSNMPGGSIGHTTTATDGVGGTDESDFFEIALGASGIDALGAGTNVIAVEVHQVSVTSSDLSFDLELIADIAPPADTDEDGMPDDYEFAYGLNAYSGVDAVADIDLDGRSNLFEYLTGFSPIDAADFLRIGFDGFSAPDVADFRLNKVIPGRTYFFEGRDDFDAPFVPVIPPFSVPAEEIDYLLRDPSALGALKIYRMGVTDP